jgi:glycosyltransferase involved in cell wall biosynthesis
VKGHEFAFEIMRQLQKIDSDIVLHCTGVEESPEDLTNVVAHGWLEQEKKIELLQRSSLLLIPSKWEGQPMVALEALACGTPVLASDSIHSLPSIIHKAKNANKNSWLAGIESILTSKNNQIIHSESVLNHQIVNVNSSLRSIYSDILSSQS